MQVDEESLMNLSSKPNLNQLWAARSHTQLLQVSFPCPHKIQTAFIDASADIQSLQGPNTVVEVEEIGYPSQWPKNVVWGTTRASIHRKENTLERFQERG